MGVPKNLPSVFPSNSMPVRSIEINSKVLVLSKNNAIVFELIIAALQNKY